MTGWRDDRLVVRQGFAHVLFDMVELRVTIRGLPPFQGFAITLEAEILCVEHFANHGPADLVTHHGEFFRQTARALTGPAQR